MRPWDRLYRLREQRGQQPQWVCADRSPIMLLRALERTCWALGVGHWHHSWHSFSHGYTWLDQKSENQSHFHFQRAATAPRGRPPCAPAAARSCPVVFSLHLVCPPHAAARCTVAPSLFSTLARARHGRRVSHPRVAFHGAQPQPLPMQHRGLELKLRHAPPISGQVCSLLRRRHQSGLVHEQASFRSWRQLAGTRTPMSSWARQPRTSSRMTTVEVWLWAVTGTVAAAAVIGIGKRKTQTGGRGERATVTAKPKGRRMR